MLYLIGLGLNPDDVSLRAQQIIKSCDKVFLDAYTSILVSYEDMKILINSVLQRDDIIQCDRPMVEQTDGVILDSAKTGNVAFLVAGDIFCATTHCNLYMHARELGIEVSCLHNASIINAVSCTGLEIYKFGRTVSIPFFTDSWHPSSFLSKTRENYEKGMHTLLLLQMNTKELNIPAMLRGIDKYDPPTYMYNPLAARQCLTVLAENPDEFRSVISPDSLCIGCMRVGTDRQQLVCTTLQKMAAKDDSHYGGPLHSLIIPGEISDMEARMLKLFSEDKSVSTILDSFIKDS